MKKSIGLTGILAAAFLAGSLALAAGDLNNSAWHMTEKGGKKDTLLFIDGKFTSSECVPYGFTTGDYNANPQGDRLGWSATQSSAASEKMEWKGEASGKTMKGSWVYTDKKGKASTMDWTATRVEPK